MAYDVKCWDLAEDFLKDERSGLYTSAETDELAQRIQDTIENFIAEREMRP